MSIFYSLFGAEKRANELSYEFIVAQECREEYKDDDGEIAIRERKFILFKNAEEYYSKIDAYPFCHEVTFARHGNVRGRLAFDFDIALGDYEDNLKERVEEAVKETFRLYYKGVDINLLKFVWMSSSNPNKVSKHLIVKNCLFEDWVEQMKYFYSNLQKVDRLDSLVDYQLVRKRASLRLPLNSKLNGSKLYIDDNRYDFFDALIYPIHRDRVTERRILYFNQKFRFKKIITKSFDLNSAEEKAAYHYIESNPDISEQFKIDCVKNNTIQLKRTKSGKCPISGRVHDSDNACVVITVQKGYIFHCYRGCKANNKACIKLSDDKKKVFLSKKQKERIAKLNALYSSR